ncbi:MAG: hypothetical protein ACXVR2_20505, partial [Solirubrobacteraceae bacterium]
HLGHRDRRRAACPMADVEGAPAALAPHIQPRQLRFTTASTAIEAHEPPDAPAVEEGEALGGPRLS